MKKDNNTNHKTSKHLSNIELNSNSDNRIYNVNKPKPTSGAFEKYLIIMTVNSKIKKTSTKHQPHVQNVRSLDAYKQSQYFIVAPNLNNGRAYEFFRPEASYKSHGNLLRLQRTSRRRRKYSEKDGWPWFPEPLEHISGVYCIRIINVGYVGDGEAEASLKCKGVRPSICWHHQSFRRCVSSVSENYFIIYLLLLIVGKLVMYARTNRTWLISDGNFCIGEVVIRS